MEIKEHTVFVGDVHGCYDEFVELLYLVDVKSPLVRVICLGDFLDRGPSSTACIRKAKELNLESVRGNHEAKYLKWFRAQGSQAAALVNEQHVPDHYSQFTDEDINYIAQMPLYIQLPDVVAIHAGLKPGIPVSKQSAEDLCYRRYTEPNGKFVSLKKINRVGKAEANAHFWTEYGSFNTNVVYGHNVWTEPRIDRYDDGTACYGIDTGCCFGQSLTALIWETKSFVQVKAKEVYYQSSFAIR